MQLSLFEKSERELIIIRFEASLERWITIGLDKKMPAEFRRHKDTLEQLKSNSDYTIKLFTPMDILRGDNSTILNRSDTSTGRMILQIAWGIAHITRNYHKCGIMIADYRQRYREVLKNFSSHDTKLK